MILKNVFIIILSPFELNCQASINANITHELLYCQDKTAHGYKKRIY
jgi:hypothetical protein